MLLLAVTTANTFLQVLHPLPQKSVKKQGSAPSRTQNPQPSSCSLCLQTPGSPFILAFWPIRFSHSSQWLCALDLGGADLLSSRPVQSKHEGDTCFSSLPDCRVFGSWPRTEDGTLGNHKTRVSSLAITSYKDSWGFHFSLALKQRDKDPPPRHMWWKPACPSLQHLRGLSRSLLASQSPLFQISCFHCTLELLHVLLPRSPPFSPLFSPILALIPTFSPKHHQQEVVVCSSIWSNGDVTRTTGTTNLTM